MALGKQIRYYREARKLTLEALAEAAHVEIGTISALENRDSHRSKYTAALAGALGLTVEQLLDESRDWTKQAPSVYTPTIVNHPPVARDSGAPPPQPPSDFHDTRAPSDSEWQVLHDLEVYPEEERKKLMAELHSQAERWRAIERELTARAKAKAKDTP